VRAISELKAGPRAGFFLALGCQIGVRMILSTGATKIAKRPECGCSLPLSSAEMNLPTPVRPSRKLNFSAAILFVIGLLLIGCRSPAPNASLQRFEFSKPQMGTLVRITLYAANEITARNAADAAFRRIAALEDIMSDYQADSELMRLSAQPCLHPVPVSAELFDILTRARKISELSNGAFDVTVGPYVRLWRFSRKRKSLPTAEELAAARAAVGWQKLRLDVRTRTVTLLVPNMRLDLGGMGKGYAADAALRVLKQRGITRALVAASGDIAIGDPPPGQRGWKIGVSAIDGSTNVPVRTLLLHNAGTSTSGDSEQFVEIGGIRYSHIVDPTTGLGMTNRIQATIVAPDATTTDSLDTTVCLLGVKRGLALVECFVRTATLVFTKENGVEKSFESRRFKSFILYSHPATP
jgi:thiamine biosynthesis lipoprotein